MDNLVIDSSVALKWFVAEPYSPEARRILDGYQLGTLAFLAPDLISAEVGNVVWKKQVLQGLAPTDAQLIINAFRALPFALTSTAELLGEAYQLATTYRRTVYDMMYLALGLREQCRFVTADEKMVNAIGSQFPNMIWIANWP